MAPSPNHVREVEASTKAAPRSTHFWRRGWRWWLILSSVWLVSGIYEGRHLMHGWVPHDEGQFAQSADRVLHGEIPHRDYLETYTGGLSYLNALAFRLVGENFATTRLVLFLFFLCWIPAVYWIASQLASDWIAGGITFLAVAWSVPNYSAAVPSWYNLFFATFGVAGLSAYITDRAPKWAFLGGLAGGLSFLVKVAALYYLLGAFLFFLFLEQSTENSSRREQKPRSLAYSAFAAAALLLVITAVARLIQKRPSIGAYVSLLVPTAVLVGFLLWNESAIRGRSDRERFFVLLRMLVPFGTGFVVPVVLFLIPFISSNALSSIFDGIFILPFKRISDAYRDPPEVITILPTVLLTALVAIGGRVSNRGRKWLTLAGASLWATLLVTSATSRVSYQIVWLAANWIFLPLTIMGIVAVGRTADDGDVTRRTKRSQLFLLISVASLCSLVQFPFAAPIYFCYVAPLVILALAGVLRCLTSVPRALVFVSFIGFLAFALFRLTPTSMYMLSRYDPNVQTGSLDLPRAGGLRVTSDSARMYGKLIPLIQRHAGQGMIYATPDCPEVYFLAGYKNPTPTIYDFFDDPKGRRERLLKMIDSHPIRLVALDLKPGFSRSIDPDLYRTLVARFPEKETVGHFEVRWKP
jgi:hypothetical protein